jgi:SAM-dependent methyltransferase
MVRSSATRGTLGRCTSGAVMGASYRLGLGSLGVMEPKEIVRRGYDALSYRYRGDAEEPTRYATWVAQLRERVSAGGAILDLGCGCGVPLARDLAAGGYAVTGVDLSAVQVERARELVPTARFLRADATQVRFPAASFDAVVSLYALIHIPLEEQPALLGRIGRWLRPGGWAAGHHRPAGLDRVRERLAGWRHADVVEPCRRRDLPAVDRAGRPGRGL